MLKISTIDRGIKFTNHRFLLCILLSQHSKNIYRNPTFNGTLARAIDRALEDIVDNKIGVFLPKLLTEYNGDLRDVGRNYDEGVKATLFALASADFEKEEFVHVGREYSIHVGISSEEQDEYESNAFSLKLTGEMRELPFDFIVHLTGNLRLIGDWHQLLEYQPVIPGPQLVDFTFEVIRKGPSEINVDCYHERRWLRTIDFNFEAVEMELVRSGRI